MSHDSDRSDSSAASAPRVGAFKGRDIVHAIAWTGAGRYVGQIVRWGVTMLVARILEPGDYGLVGMTALFSGMMALLAEFGIGTAVLKMRTLSDDRIAQLHGLSVLLGVLALAVTAACAPWLAHFFRRPELTAIVAVSAMGFVTASFQTIPMAILQREMRFKTLASVEAGGAVGLALLTLLAAVSGASYWSLVVPSLVVSALTGLIYSRLARISMAKPVWTNIKDAYSFSSWVFLGRFAGYVYANADFLVVGRVLGGSALGTYTFAWDLVQAPNDQINGLVSRVSASYYSALQDQREETARLFSNFLEAVSCVSIPAIIGLGLVAPEFVSVVLGAKWSAATVPLQILCVYSASRIAIIFVTPLLAMLGDVRFQSLVMMAGAAYLPVLFYFGAILDGTRGVSLAWLLGYPPIVLAMFWRAQNRLGLDMKWLMTALKTSISCTVVMTLTVLLTRFSLTDALPMALKLVCLILAGVVSYTAALFLLFPSRVAALRVVLRDAIRGPSR